MPYHIDRNFPIECGNGHMLDEQKGNEENSPRLPPASDFTSPYDAGEFQEYMVSDVAPALPLSFEPGPAWSSKTILPPHTTPTLKASALPKKSTGRKNILLAALALLLVASVGGGFLFYASRLRPQPVSIQSHSLPTSPQALFKQVTGRKPLLYDLLTNEVTSTWHSSSDPSGDGQCFFEADGYHITNSQQETFYSCMSTGYYVNFAFQVQVTILSGDGASLIFRGSQELNKFYRFRIDQYGNYALLLSNNPSTSVAPQALRAGASQYINQGPEQTNVLTVIATGSDIYLYINSHFIVHERDATLSAGEIGLSATDFSKTTEVLFYRAEVWRL